MFPTRQTQRIPHPVSNKTTHGIPRHPLTLRRLRQLPLLLSHFALHLTQLVNYLAVNLLRKLQRIQQYGLRHELCTSLNHHDRIASSGYRQLQPALAQLLIRRIDYQLVVDQPDVASAYRVVERNVRYRQRCRRTDNPKRRMWVYPVRRKHCDD